MNVCRSFFRDKLYGKYLLVTNTVSGGLFMFAGDFTQQKLELYRGKSEKYDAERASKYLFRIIQSFYIN